MLVQVCLYIPGQPQAHALMSSSPGKQDDSRTLLPFLGSLLGAHNLLSGFTPEGDMWRAWGKGTCQDLLLSWTPLHPVLVGGVCSSFLSWAQGTGLRAGPWDPGYVPDSGLSQSWHLSLAEPRCLC